MRTADRIVARVDHDDADGQPLLHTSQAGTWRRSPPPAPPACVTVPFDDARVVRASTGRRCSCGSSACPSSVNRNRLPSSSAEFDMSAQSIPSIGHCRSP